MTSRRPRLARGDLVLDAARTIRSRPGRAIALGLAVALGVATYVGIVSMSTSANRRTSERIARLRPELVRIASTESDLRPGSLDRRFTPEVLGADRHARFAAIADTYPETPVRARATAPVVPATVIGGEGDLLHATRSPVSGEAFPSSGLVPDAHVAVVGAGVADRIGLADPAAAPAIWIDGIAFTVTGVIDDSTYLSLLIDAVVIPRSTAQQLMSAAPLATAGYVRTDRGEANRVAGDLPLRISPQSPEAWSVDVPQVPTDVSDGISADLRNLTLAVSALVMAIGVVAIANAMMRSVYERTSEIGLRRSLGARATHIVAMVVYEAATIGLIAGVLGVALGTAAAAVVASRNGWPVAIEPGPVLTALAAATAAGIVAGLIPGVRAVRITPSEALRRD